MVKPNPDQFELFPPKPDARVDFSSLDPDVYAERVRSRAPKNPYYEQDKRELDGTGLEPDPSGLDPAFPAERPTDDEASLDAVTALRQTLKQHRQKGYVAPEEIPSSEEHAAQRRHNHLSNQ